MKGLAALVEQCQICYQAYLESGKRFRHAYDLKSYNEQIRALLLERMDELPADQKSNAEGLLLHIQDWERAWEAKFHADNPGPDSVFVFYSAVRFPRAQVASLLRHRDRRTGPGNSTDS